MFNTYITCSNCTLKKTTFIPTYVNKYYGENMKQFSVE